MGFFSQAVALFYGAVLLGPDEHLETMDLWRFHLENRRRYIPALIVYLLLGCWLALTFLPTDQFLSAVYMAGLPMVALVVWYFATYLPGFSS